MRETVQARQHSLTRAESAILTHQNGKKSGSVFRTVPQRFGYSAIGIGGKWSAAAVELSHPIKVDDVVAEELTGFGKARVGNTVRFHDIGSVPLHELIPAHSAGSLEIRWFCRVKG